MDTEPRAVFGARLKKHFNKKSLSDAVIRCGGQEFPIHRIVLCIHSEYFIKQLDGPWKESSEGVIEIVDFDVSLVKAMIYFTYHLNYDIPYGSSAMAFHAGMGIQDFDQRVLGGRRITRRNQLGVYFDTFQ
ncbi:hypothetical protein NXS19_006670 [Fusarium pseudograminearum]|nr:hypothetical protein NXS19_006670 [Fusarium pseudograminearum]